MYLDRYLLSLMANNKTRTNFLYPYHSQELAILFAYGSDFTRQKDMFMIPGSVRTLSGAISLFICFSAAILCVIRRKLKLRRNGLLSSIIDTWIPFIGGSKIQIQHKAERWFFGILISTSFFMTTLWTCDFLYYTSRLQDQKVETLEQLAKINPPIFLVQSTLKYGEDFAAVLRFASVQILLD